MEEKNVTKISLSTFFLILAIIVIIVMGIFIYKLNNDKTAEIQKSTKLQSQINNLNRTISDLQGKINSISETINSSGNATNSEKSNNTNVTSSKNKTLEESNVTNNVNKTGLIGETTYEIGNSATNHLDGFDVILEDSKVYFKLTNKEKIKSYSITDSTINRVENKKEEITGFNGKVKKVYFYQVGQTVMPDSLAILFLMEDGKIEYISYVDALQTNTLKSRGEITGLYNISDIYSASACEWVDKTGGPSWESCIAKDSSNNYYSLEIAFKKNNIDLSKVK